VIKTILLLLLCLISSSCFAHEVSAEDIHLIRGLPGIQLTHYLYLGAKHMVTGYDHLLFLLGMIFYIRLLRDVLILVSLFAIGHSVTLIFGVVFSWNVSPYLVDAIIGFSVAYKGFDNLNGLQSLIGKQPNEKLMVLVFGLFHGLGLSTTLQTLVLRNDSLISNLLAFNVGVELGQIAALTGVLLLLKCLPLLRSNEHISITINIGLMTVGFALMAYQLNQYVMIS
jgi:hypothetical protein